MCASQSQKRPQKERRRTEGTEDLELEREGAGPSWEEPHLWI